MREREREREGVIYLDRKLEILLRSRSVLLFLTLMLFLLFLPRIYHHR